MKTERERNWFAFAAASLVTLVVLLNVFQPGRGSSPAREYEPVRIVAAQTGAILPDGDEELAVRSGSDGMICVTSMNSDVYHDPECSYVQRILEKNKEFLSVTDMERAGKRPCKVCMAD